MSQADSCRKLLASFQPHFSSDGFLSPLHLLHFPDICLPRILPSSMCSSLGVPSFPPLFPPTCSTILSCNHGLACSMTGLWKNNGMNMRHLFPGDMRKESDILDGRPSVWRFMWGSRVRGSEVSGPQGRFEMFPVRFAEYLSASQTQRDGSKVEKSKT